MRRFADIQQFSTIVFSRIKIFKRHSDKAKELRVVSCQHIDDDELRRLRGGSTKRSCAEDNLKITKNRTLKNTGIS
jgi:hypothetical protein